MEIQLSQHAQIYAVDGCEVQATHAERESSGKTNLHACALNTPRKYLLRKLRINVLGDIEIHFRKSSFFCGEK